MKILYLRICGYKSLKDIEINFKEQNEPAAVQFFIGENGSGKSTILEAIGLIFTRIMQETTPGFYFKIEYEIGNGQHISIESQKPEFRDEAGRTRDLLVRINNQISNYKVPDEFLPDKIIAYYSGSNTTMENVMTSSLRTTLASKIYDAVYNQKELKNQEEVRGFYDKYNQLDMRPKILYLDEIMAKIILPVLFAVLPLDTRSASIQQDLSKYLKLRCLLLSHLNVIMEPVAFSFTINNELLDATDTQQSNIIRSLIEYDNDTGRNIGDWMAESLSGNTVNEELPTRDTTLVFRYQRYSKEDKESYYHPALQEFFDGNAVTLLMTMVSAYRSKIIKDIQFVFKCDGGLDLLGMDALSDGELMWLARMGLILLSQKHCGDNILFLYDEPDIHFNDDWNNSFIKILYALGEQVNHEFLIATHSTLILTDAKYEQINLLTRNLEKGVMLKDAYITPFAAERGEISTQIFGTSAIGLYATKCVKEMQKEEDREEMIKNIAQLGPGIERFRLYEQFFLKFDAEL